jgi:hypothetical protein
MSMPRLTRCWHCGSPPNFGPGVFDAQRRGRDTTLECAAIRLRGAVAALAKAAPGTKITYFEASPTKDDEAYKRWTELNDSLALLNGILADRKASEVEHTADGGTEHG